MATFSFTNGVDETEATLISDYALKDVDGAEYRVGQPGLYVARGRKLYGNISGVTGKGLYDAAFDGGKDFVLAQQGNTYYVAPIAGSLSFTSLGAVGKDTLPVVGTHYANRHYLANGKANRKLELDGVSVTPFTIGMNRSTFAVGLSITQGTSDMSATTGLEYWVTEYDSLRGIESMAGTTAHTGPFSSKDGVVVTVTGSAKNGRYNTIRWYRSVDGGGFPDGGLIRETAAGTTQITDQLFTTGTLTVPSYGIVSVGGLDVERDEPPPVFDIIFGPFQDSLLGVQRGAQRSLRFTPAGYPESWPTAYAIPLETERNDEIIAGVALSDRIGVFCKDSVHVVYRLPRDSDSIFAAGESQEPITKSRGCVSRRGVAMFRPPGSEPLVIFVARDGLWATNLSSAPVAVTDKINWEGRVDTSKLDTSRLLDDPINRRIVFLYRKKTDSTFNTGIWYIDYQEFTTLGLRVTFADHGALADAITIAYTDGTRRVVSFDSRDSNGNVYVEAIQDKDDSTYRDSSGSVRFRARSKEFMTAGPRGVAALGKATFMHDAGPPKITHRFYFNRRDNNPEVKQMEESTIRTASTVSLQRTVNSVSVEIESTGTKSYGLHWVDIEGFDLGELGGLRGA